MLQFYKYCQFLKGLMKVIMPLFLSHKKKSEESINPYKYISCHISCNSKKVTEKLSRRDTKFSLLRNWTLLYHFYIMCVIIFVQHF